MSQFPRLGDTARMSIDPSYRNSAVLDRYGFADFRTVRICEFRLRGSSAIRPQHRRQELKERNAHLLQMLIANKKDPVGLSQTTVANEMQQRLDALDFQVRDCYQTLRNDIKGTRVPQQEHAWALRDGLRKTVPWMNGYCMLWATGAYEFALDTLLRFTLPCGALQPSIGMMLQSTSMDSEPHSSQPLEPATTDRDTKILRRRVGTNMRMGLTCVNHAGTWTLIGPKAHTA